MPDLWPLCGCLLKKEHITKQNSLKVHLRRPTLAHTHTHTAQLGNYVWFYSTHFSKNLGDYSLHLLDNKNIISLLKVGCCWSSSSFPMLNTLLENNMHRWMYVHSNSQKQSSCHFCLWMKMFNYGLHRSFSLCRSTKVVSLHVPHLFVVRSCHINSP